MRYVAFFLLMIVSLFGANIAPAEQSNAALPNCTETTGPTRALGLFKPGTPVSLEDGFRDPPSISRVHGWWQCFGSAFTKAEITRELEEFKAQGMGGVTVKDTINMPQNEHPNGIRDIDYVSSEWLGMFAHMDAECKRLGLIFRNRLGSGWNEGGPWITPEMSSLNIAFAKSKPTVGRKTFVGQIPTADGLPTAQAITKGDAFVVAVSDEKPAKRVDLTQRVGPDLKLTWDVPEGTWTLVSCFGKASGVHNMSTSTSGNGLDHDHLSTAAADVHLENVAERMLAKLSKPEDTAFDGFNSDSWEINNPSWTPGFRQAFIDRRHYDPVPFLPVMAKVPEVRGMWSEKSRYSDEAAVTGKLSEEELRFLFDFRTTVSDLIVENFYQYVHQWCREHHVVLDAEAGGGPGHIVPNDLLQAQGAVDIPMGEFWVNGRSYVKVASSAAHAYGRRIVGLESLTQAGPDYVASPAVMKPRVDEAFLLGGNNLSMSIVEYSPAEAGLPGWSHTGAGPHLNHCQTFWPMIRPFYDYIARCCFLLQSGENVAHAAVYRTFRHGATALWICDSDDKLSKFPTELAFDYVGDELIQQQMSVRDGRIVLRSGATYEVLCIDPTPRSTMPLATLEKIRDLIEQGGKVVWLGQPPERCPGLTEYPKCDVEFQSIIKELRDSGKLVVLPKPDLAGLVPIVEKSAHPPAWRTPSKVLRFVHRRTSDADIFFVVNREDKQLDVPVTFRIKNRQPELWNPETGVMKPATCEGSADGTLVKMRLPALGSAFVVFREQTAPVQSVSETQNKSFEPIPITGPWEVEFPKGSGAPPKATFPVLKSWTEMQESGIRYFSGMATYRTTFNCPETVATNNEAVQLDLGRVAVVCEVSINGKSAGVGWHPPYAVDVTGLLIAGENRIEVRVANLWHNRLVGDASLPKEQRVSRIVPESHYNALRGKKLMPSGLLGPVQILNAP